METATLSTIFSVSAGVIRAIADLGEAVEIAAQKMVDAPKSYLVLKEDGSFEVECEFCSPGSLILASYFNRASGPLSGLWMAETLKAFQNSRVAKALEESIEKFERAKVTDGYEVAFRINAIDLWCTPHRAKQLYDDLVLLGLTPTRACLFISDYDREDSEAELDVDSWAEIFRDTLPGLTFQSSGRRQSDIIVVCRPALDDFDPHSFVQSLEEDRYEVTLHDPRKWDQWG